MLQDSGSRDMEFFAKPFLLPLYYLIFLTSRSLYMGWRREIKTVILTAFDNTCSICGYNKCQDALEFHHLIRENKDFSISNLRLDQCYNIISELKKCICVCSNCHREIHFGITKLPEIVKRYNTRKSNIIISFCNKLYDDMILEKTNKYNKRKQRYYRPFKKKKNKDL